MGGKDSGGVPPKSQEKQKLKMEEKKAHQDQRRRESDSVFLAGLEFGASHLGHNPAVLSEMEKLDQKKKNTFPEENERKQLSRGSSVLRSGG